jgi:AcrR family transcriptional regulator
VITAAIALADRDGAAALSMRNLARELGVGAMTLYSYVQHREELLDAMFDRIAEDILLTDRELDADWRDAAVTIAHRTLRMFVEHRWLIEVMHADRASYTPTMVRHAEQTMVIVAKLTDDWKRGLHLFDALDDYVFGHALRTVTSMDKKFDALRPQLDRMIDTGDFPHLARYREQHGSDIDDPESFEHGLQVVLDGIEAAVSPRRRAARPRRGA